MNYCDRLRILHELDIDGFIEAIRQDGLEPPSREIAEISIHKVRAVWFDLTDRERRESVEWLRSRGLQGGFRCDGR